VRPRYQRPFVLFTEGQSVLAKVVPAAARKRSGGRKQMDVSERLSDVAKVYEESGRELMQDYVNFYTGLRAMKAQEGRKLDLFVIIVIFIA
jgi:hypothetical protein